MILENNKKIVKKKKKKPLHRNYDVIDKWKWEPQTVSNFNQILIF